MSYQSDIVQLETDLFSVLQSWDMIQNINIVQQQNNSGIWVLLAVIFACPLMCVGLMAVAFLRNFAAK